MALITEINNTLDPSESTKKKDENCLSPKTESFFYEKFDDRTKCEASESLISINDSIFDMVKNEDSFIEEYTEIEKKNFLSSDLVFYVEKNVQESPIKQNGFFICQKCDIRIFKHLHFIIHTKFCNKNLMYKCTECLKSFSEFADLNTHLKTHYQISYICTKCIEKFTDFKILQMHIKIHILEIDEKPINNHIPVKKTDIDYSSINFNKINHNLTSLLNVLHTLKHKQKYKFNKFKHLNTLKCYRCNLNFHSKIRLSIHHSNCKISHSVSIVNFQKNCSLSNFNI